MIFFMLPLFLIELIHGPSSLFSKEIERVKNYQCQLCPAAYYKSSHLKQHHNTKHMKKPTLYKCKICKKAFKRNDMLTRHRRIHTPRETWNNQCSQCNRRFSRSDHLKNHLKTHLPVTTSKSECLQHAQTIPEERIYSSRKTPPNDSLQEFTDAETAIIDHYLDTIEKVPVEIAEMFSEVFNPTDT